MEGLKVSNTKMTVYIHPSMSNRVSKAINRELSSLLFKFDESFEGVVLAYAVMSKDKKAKILSGLHPYFGVKIEAKLLLFSPKPGMLLEGKVVKLRKESLHVIVLGFSSAVIIEDDVREEFRYKTKHGEELFGSTSHRKHVIKVGSMIRFSVKSFDEDILHISGSLVSPNTGSIQWLDKNTEETSQLLRAIHKKKHHDFELGSHDKTQPSASEHRPLKKSKKRGIHNEF